MKPSSLITTCMLATSTLTMPPVSGRPMHAGINYELYLAEIDTTNSDYQSWKSSKYWKVANDNNWLPDQSEERSADDGDEDMRQRIFMSKQDALKAQAENPNANFSIMTPFSALTKEEFASKVLNPYVQGNKTKTNTPTTTVPTRLLRQQGGYSFTDMIDAFTKSFQQQTGSSWSIGTVQPADTASEASDPTAPWNQPGSAPSSPVTEAPSTVISTPTSTPSTTEASTTQTSSTAADSNSGSTDWSETACMSPIQNQGQCGACWAFATVAAVESLQCISTGKSSVKKYSEQQLIGCDSQNQGCGGGAPAYAFEYIQQNGLCTESIVPYALENGGSATCGTTCSQSDPGLIGYENLQAGDEAALVDALQSQPVVVAVASANEVFKQYTSGVVSSCGSTTPDHAVLAVGFDDSSIKIRNSWGEDWGEAGYIRMERSSTDMGTCGLLADMSRPKM